MPDFTYLCTMTNTKIIILDFDGTLGDTASVIIKTMQETIKELSLPPRTDAECAAMIGLRLVEIPPVLFPECNLYGELSDYSKHKIWEKPVISNTDLITGATFLIVNVPPSAISFL